MTVHTMPKYPCSFCKKNEATQFCDFVVDYGGTIFFSGRGGGVEPPQKITCDNQICKGCVTEYNGHEFCPSCNKLHDYIRRNRDKRPGRMMADIVFGRFDPVSQEKG
ncbi:hypothetical protein [Paenibacillus elgii]|uniref:hypothetical protein n=1 Tax=Paenibacillus elgii TaxID=189691 RepID=UPI001112BE34|nr:hypothetical protein [Paenibacillus elgii]